MKMLSCKCRGFGSLEKRKEVRSLVKEKRPSILCIQETKLQRCDEGVCLSVWDGQQA
jgi:exonuclease III